MNEQNEIHACLETIKNSLESDRKSKEMKKSRCTTGKEKRDSYTKEMETKKKENNDNKREKKKIPKFWECSEIKKSKGKIG